jgi:hypothetical protein
MQTASLVLLIGGIGLGLFSVLALVPTVMLFDDGNIDDRFRWIVFYLWAALPFLCLVAQVFGWIMYSRGLYLVSLRSSLALFGYAVVAVAALLRTFK